MRVRDYGAPTDFPQLYHLKDLRGETNLLINRVIRMTIETNCLTGQLCVSLPAFIENDSVEMATALRAIATLVGWLAFIVSADPATAWPL